MQTDFQNEAKDFTNPEAMASAYLARYYGQKKIEYPINPFQMLKDEDILFSLRNFKKLEGVYIPASSSTDLPVVGINANRNITRQRFTAAHELCHHFRDADRQIVCPINGYKNEIELFADKFAAALLMPIGDLRYQVNKRKNQRGYVSFDSVLEIADYFGVSFISCLYRIAYRIHAIAGDTAPRELRKRAEKYKPDTVRKTRHLTHCKLFEGLIDCYQEQLTFKPTDYARYLFQNNYIYNDSRMEGLDVSIEQASEIVTDIRLNTKNSFFSCDEDNEVFFSIAGHYDMYQDILADPVKESLSVFDMFLLNKKLYSHYPNPDFGGSIRQNNTLVLGAKFETVDYHDILPELEKLDKEVKDFYSLRHEIPMSEYVKHVVRTHHQITVIHPFQDGNGRTSRAFMNVQLVRAGLLPIYIRVEDKEDYVNALSLADECNNYDELYDIVFRQILKTFVDLSLEG